MKMYNIYAIVDTGEIDKHFVCSYLAEEMYAIQADVSAYLEGYKAGIELMNGEVDFEHEAEV